MARRSGSFNYADYRNSTAGRPPVAPPSGRSSPRGKGRINIPAGPGFDERRNSKTLIKEEAYKCCTSFTIVFENQTRRITLTPQQRRKVSTKHCHCCRYCTLCLIGWPESSAKCQKLWWIKGFESSSSRN